jgi:hypothetical protein
MATSRTSSMQTSSGCPSACALSKHWSNACINERWRMTPYFVHDARFTHLEIRLTPALLGHFAQEAVPLFLGVILDSAAAGCEENV